MKTILFQGDSITDCNRLREGDKNVFQKIYDKMHKRVPLGEGYPAMVAAELNSQVPGEYTFINRGCGGDRIVDVYGRIVKDIINLKPDCMSLLVGVNDVWRAYDSNNGTGIRRFEKTYELFLEEMKQELPDTKLIIMGDFILEGTATQDRPDQPGRYNSFRSDVEEVATVTKALAEKYGHKFIDLQSVFDAAEKITPASELAADGVHPTDKGHKLIMSEWIKAYKELQ